jgi:hypothetical protein
MITTVRIETMNGASGGRTSIICPSGFRTSIPRALVALGLLLASACGDDEPAAGANSNANASSASTFVCDNRAIESRCFDYWSGATRSDVGASCDGVVAETACTGTVVGRCTVNATNEPYAGKAITGVYFSEGPAAWTSASAEANCAKLGGAFSK